MLFNIGLIAILVGLLNFSVAEYSTCKKAKIIGYSNSVFMLIVVLAMIIFTM